MSWRERAPGPFSLWARFAPRSWPATASFHVDPIEGALAPRGAARAAAEAPAPPSLPSLPPLEPDVTYLPPVPAPRAAERDALADEIASRGGHALVHLRPEETTASAAATPVVDLLAPLLAEGAPDAIAIPPRAWVLVPLVAGLLDDAVRRRLWLERLARAGATAVAIVPRLEPTDRRALAEAAGEARWDSFFHGTAIEPSALAREAAGAGVATIPLRPSIALPPRAARNRALSTALATAGELWLRLGQSESEGEALLAAARRVDGEALDFAALSREGNLGIVGWLSPRARRLIEEQLDPEPSESGELATLRREWSGEREAGASA